MKTARGWGWFAWPAGFLSTVLILCPSGARGDYQSKGKRDPFVPLLTLDGQRIRPPGLDEEAAEENGGISLQGIVFDSEKDSYALINGQVVRAGDQIGSTKVLKIEPHAVTLQAEGRVFQITVRAPEEDPS